MENKKKVFVKKKKNVKEIWFQNIIQTGILSDAYKKALKLKKKSKQKEKTNER